MGYYQSVPLLLTQPAQLSLGPFVIPDTSYD